MNLGDTLETAALTIGKWILSVVAEITKKNISNFITQHHRPHDIVIKCMLQEKRINGTQIDVKIWNTSTTQITTSPINFTIETIRRGQARRTNVSFTPPLHDTTTQDPISIPRRSFQTFSFSPDILVACLNEIPEITKGKYKLTPFVEVDGFEVYSKTYVTASK